MKKYVMNHRHAQKYPLKCTRKGSKLTLSKFEMNILEDLPENLKELWSKQPFKYKMFVLHLFDSKTATEAALKAGYHERSAPTTAGHIKKKLQPIIDWIENGIFRELQSRIIENNIISREVIVEKLARMFLPNIGDFEDIESAKRKGLMDAVKKMKFGMKENKDFDPEEEISAYNQPFVKYVEELELHDPVKTANLICDMMGYKAPKKTELSGEVNGTAGGGDRPVNIQINVVHSNQEK